MVNKNKNTNKNVINIKIGDIKKKSKRRRKPSTKSGGGGYQGPNNIVTIQAPQPAPIFTPQQPQQFSEIPPFLLHQNRSQEPDLRTQVEREKLKQENEKLERLLKSRLLNESVTNVPIKTESLGSDPHDEHPYFFEHDTNDDQNLLDADKHRNHVLSKNAFTTMKRRTKSSLGQKGIYEYIDDIENRKDLYNGYRGLYNNAVDNHNTIVSNDRVDAYRENNLMASGFAKFKENIAKMKENGDQNLLDADKHRNHVLSKNAFTTMKRRTKSSLGQKGIYEYIDDIENRKDLYNGYRGLYNNAVDNHNTIVSNDRVDAYRENNLMASGFAKFKENIAKMKEAKNVNTLNMATIYANDGDSIESENNPLNTGMINDSNLSLESIASQNNPFFTPQQFTSQNTPNKPEKPPHNVIYRAFNNYSPNTNLIGMLGKAQRVRNDDSSYDSEASYARNKDITLEQFGDMNNAFQKLKKHTKIHNFLQQQAPEQELASASGFAQMNAPELSVASKEPVKMHGKVPAKEHYQTNYAKRKSAYEDYVNLTRSLGRAPKNFKHFGTLGQIQKEIQNLNNSVQQIDFVDSP